MPTPWDQLNEMWGKYRDEEMTKRFGPDWYDRYEAGDEEVRQGFIEVLDAFKAMHPEFR